jgi:hypothetical protein
MSARQPNRYLPLDDSSTGGNDDDDDESPTTPVLRLSPTKNKGKKQQRTKEINKKQNGTNGLL